MLRTVETGWVKAPHQITGLDHLGVQAPCIQIYSQLLPGITNVTDRARYYSFYPWLLSRFEKAGWRSEEQVLEKLRRAECLLTLISLHHEQTAQDGVDDHRAAMVGVDTLVRAISKISEGDAVTITDYSDLQESNDRYFANPVGGLGQYYFGALWGLGLLAGESPKTMRLPKGAGTFMAAQMEKYVPGDRFVEILSENRVDGKALNELTPFCACQLKTAMGECDALINVLLRGWGGLDPHAVPSIEEQESNNARAHSLAYLCLLADAAYQVGDDFDITTFRSMSYTGFNSEGRVLEMPSTLSQTIEHWRVYQRNEILSIAIQGLMFATLRSADLSGIRFADTRSLAEWFWADGAGSYVLKDMPAGAIARDWMTSLSDRLPPYSEWAQEGHECYSMERVAQATRRKDVKSQQVIEIVYDSLSMIAAILMREENQAGYSEVPFPDGYLDYYPVNLTSIRTDWERHLSLLPIEQSLSLLVKNDCLDNHLRVAMRKLRQQGRNTFRFEPAEIGIVIKEIPKAAHTSPRFKQAIRILIDLGILDRSGNSIHLTSKGGAFVEAAL